MQKMYSKVLSILLTVCIIGSMLPTVAFAEEGVQDSGVPSSTSKTKQLATNLQVNGLPTIAVGQRLPTSIEGITVSNCTVTELSWTEAVSGNFLGMSKDISEDYYNYTFIPGRTYMIKIAITANEGYKLNTYSASGEVSAVQSVDGELVDSDKSKVAYDSQETKKHTVWYLYDTLPEDEENKISKLTFTCQEPTIGQALCVKNAIAVTDCDISNIVWRKNNIATSDGMCDGAGKYELKIVCVPKEGKYFAKDLTATINNNKITVINNSPYNGYYNTDLKYTFTVTETNVDAIVPTITAHPADANYTVGDTATVLTTGANIGDGGTLSYQWYSNAINSNNGGAEISGEKTEIYTPPTATARTTYYYCVVTNTNNSATGNKTATATSNTAKIIVTNDDSYSITVHNGTANLLTAAENATVTITANTPPDSGKRFKVWTVVSGGVTLASTTSATTTFTMPANAVVVTATYESISVSGTDITDKFTDANFLAEVRTALKKYGTFPILDTYDFAAVTSLSISNKDIKSLAGIEYFTELTTLNCNDNQLTELDVSKNTKLTHLNCAGNQLTELDVSKITALIELHCFDNQLSTLNMSNNTALTRLDCKGNQLITLDVSKITELTELWCNENQLTALNVSKNTKLVALRCQNNQLPALDMSKNTVLTELWCNENRLTTLDLSNNTALSRLYCSNNYMADKSAVTGLDMNLMIDFFFDPQNTSTSVYPITINSGTASTSTAVAGATVTITANAPGSGQQFKEWTVVSSGVTFANAQAESTTFAMPANAVEVTATYEDIPAGVIPVTGVTLNKNNLSLYSNTKPNTATVIATVAPVSATDQSVTWKSSNTAVATVDISGNIKATGSGTTTITVETTDGGYTASCTVAISTYSSGGGSSSGGSSGGGSPSSVSSSTTNTKTTKPEQKPNQTVIAAAPIIAIAGTNGAARASITDKSIFNAITKAQADAKAQGKTTNDVYVELNVTMPNGATALTATLTRSSMDSLVSAGVTKLEISGAPVTVTFDKKALTEIQKKSSGNINITIDPKTNLSETAKKMIGSRPVYNITVNDDNSSMVSSFGGGAATVAIPYAPANGEVIDGVYAVYVDEKGNATRIAGSAYDANSGCVIFTTPHFSMYGVGYTAPSERFIDINSHWAKESIEYVVGRGLLLGTTETAFAPNTAMTRGMLVIALGRLAGIDIKAYTTSSFTDVNADSAYSPYIEWAYKKEIIQGIGSNQFAPDRAITREEIAVIIANFAKATSYILPVTCKATTYADDSSIGSTYKTAVTEMQQAGIMMGGTSNKFNPKSNATRAEVSSMLGRYIKSDHKLGYRSGLDAE